METSDTDNSQLPVWAPRLRKSQVARLYKSCRQGVLDQQLIDDVGFSLYARCLSMLQVSESMRGRPPCPNCGAVAGRTKGPTAIVECLNCGWRCSWRAYQKTYQRKWLFAGGMEPFVSEFVQRFPVTRSPDDRLVLIDTLIHRFHWESEGCADGRPGATSFIEGKMKDVMAFLDKLTYEDDVPPEIMQRREMWRQKWRDNGWSHGKGQSS